MPQYLLEFLWVILHYSVQAVCNIYDGALCNKKKGNSWKLLLNVIAESFALNVTGLLDTTLKQVDNLH